MSYCYNTVTSKYHGRVKLIMVWENGDFYGDGHVITVNPNSYRTWNGILAFITNTLRPSFGAVRNLIHLDTKEPVHSFESLESNGKYVAVGVERLQQVKSGYKTLTEKQNGRYYTESVSNHPSTSGIPTRDRKTTFFVMTNGKAQKMPCKVVLTEADIESWETILEHIAITLEMQENIQYLFTVCGDPVVNPRHFQNGCIYIAVPRNERFINMNYLRIFRNLLPMREIDLKKVDLSAAFPHISDQIIPSNLKIEDAKAKDQISIRSSTRSEQSYGKYSQTVESVDSRQRKSISDQTKVVQSKRTPKVNALSGTNEMQNRLCSDKREAVVAKSQNTKNDMAKPSGPLSIIEETLSIDTGICDLDMSIDIDQTEHVVLNERDRSTSELKISVGNDKHIICDKKMEPPFRSKEKVSVSEGYKTKVKDKPRIIGGLVDKDKPTDKDKHVVNDIKVIPCTLKRTHSHPRSLTGENNYVGEGPKAEDPYKALEKEKLIDKDKSIDELPPPSTNISKNIKVIPCPLKKERYEVPQDYKSKSRNEVTERKVPSLLRSGLEKEKLIDQDTSIDELPPHSTNISENIKVIPCPFKKGPFEVPQDYESKSRNELTERKVPSLLRSELEKEKLIDKDKSIDELPPSSTNISENIKVIPCPLKKRRFEVPQDYESKGRNELTERKVPSLLRSELEKEKLIDKNTSIDELPPHLTNISENIKLIPCPLKKGRFEVLQDNESKDRNELTERKVPSLSRSQLKASKSNLDSSQPSTKSNEMLIFKEDNIPDLSATYLENTGNNIVRNYSDLKFARDNVNFCNPSRCGLKKKYSNNRPLIHQTPREFIDDVIRTSIVIMERAHLLQGSSAVAKKESDDNSVLSSESKQDHEIGQFHNDITLKEKYDCCKEKLSTAGETESILKNYEVCNEVNKKRLSSHEVLNKPSKQSVQAGPSESFNKSQVYGNPRYTTFSEDLRDYIAQTNEETKNSFTKPMTTTDRTCEIRDRNQMSYDAKSIEDVYSGLSASQPYLTESEVVNQSQIDQGERSKDESYMSSTIFDSEKSFRKDSGKLIAYKNSTLCPVSSEMISLKNVLEQNVIHDNLKKIPSVQKSANASINEFVAQSQSKEITGEAHSRPKATPSNVSHTPSAYSLDKSVTSKLTINGFQESPSIQRSQSIKNIAQSCHSASSPDTKLATFTQNMPQPVRSKSILVRHEEHDPRKIEKDGNSHMTNILSRDVKEHRSRMFDVPEVRDEFLDDANEERDNKRVKNHSEKAAVPRAILTDPSIVTVSKVHDRIKLAEKLPRCPSPSLKVLREDNSGYVLDDSSLLTCPCRANVWNINHTCVMKQKNAGIQVTPSNISRDSKKKITKNLNESQIFTNQKSPLHSNYKIENVHTSNTAVDKAPKLSHASVIPHSSLEGMIVGDDDDPSDDVGITYSMDNSEDYFKNKNRHNDSGNIEDE